MESFLAKAKKINRQFCNKHTSMFRHVKDLKLKYLAEKMLTTLSLKTAKLKVSLNGFTRHQKACWTLVCMSKDKSMAL